MVGVRGFESPAPASFAEAKIRVAEAFGRPDLIMTGSRRRAGSKRAVRHDTAPATPPNGDAAEPAAQAWAAKSRKPKPSPIIPVPADAPPPRWRHPKYGALVATWPYPMQRAGSSALPRECNGKRAARLKKTSIPSLFAGSIQHLVDITMHGAPPAYPHRDRFINCRR
jgi:hypothetical protein